MSHSETSADIDSIAARWAARGDRGVLTPAETRARDFWLEQDPRHLGAYVRAQAVWSDMDRMGSLAAGRNVTPLRSPWGRWRAAAMAAAALIAAGAFGAFWMVNGMAERESAEIGEVRRVALEDGSSIVLNSGSTVQTRYSDEVRRVLLREGEASFQVAKGQRPFVVKVGEVSVTALGTRFSVRRKPAGDVAVIVEEGMVEVVRQDADGGVDRRTLRANASLNVIADADLRPVRLRPEETQRRLAWQDGRLIFAGETLRAAAAEMNRYSKKKIVIEDSALAGQEFVGAFQLGDSRAFADAIATAYGADVEESDSALRIVTRS